MVAYFSGCGCRSRVREHGGGAVGFSAAEPGVERGWKGRHDGWNNVLQQCEWLLGGSGDDDGQHDVFQQLEWLVGRKGDDDGQHDLLLQCEWFVRGKSHEGRQHDLLLQCEWLCCRNRHEDRQISSAAGVFSASARSGSLCEDDIKRYAFSLTF